MLSAIFIILRSCCDRSGVHAQTAKLAFLYGGCSDRAFDMGKCIFLGGKGY